MTNSAVQPYLFFGGRCEEAVKFYQAAVGAQVEMLMRNSDNPEPHPPGRLPPGSESKVMHCTLRIGSTTMMMSDGLCDGKMSFDGFSLALTVADDAQAGQAFAALAEGGSVEMPLMKTFWSPCFGMLTDRFGLGWMVSVGP